MIAVLCSACGGDDFKCGLGEITGTWRTSVHEINGTCGAIADDTTNFSAPMDDNCQTHSSAVSPDLCRMDIDYTCPVTDARTGDMGTVHWTQVRHHVEERRIEGTGTVRVVVAGRSCQSTYDITLTKL